MSWKVVKKGIISDNGTVTIEKNDADRFIVCLYDDGALLYLQGFLDIGKAKEFFNMLRMGSL